MTHQEVAQAFADKRSTTRTGRQIQGSRMFIDDKTIFSYGYHFPIAKRTDKFLKDGREIVFFNSRGYSVSTSKHQSITARALIEHGYYLVNISNAEDPAHGFNELIAKANEYELKSMRARRDWIITSHKENARECREQAEVLREYFLN